ncbi:unnamed protein product [Closterium sp. NIES-53]
MASLRVLAFNHEGRPIQFHVWLDDVQLYLLSDSKDSVSVFDLASGAAPAPPATADTQALYDALVSHLCTIDARYRAIIPAEFLDRNQPPMFITLYFIVTRLPDSLRSVRDHFLSLDPTSLTVDLLEQHLLAAETSAIAVGAACGTPRPPFFEGCSPSPLSPSYASAAAADVPVAEDIGAASASAKRRSSKGKGGTGGGGDSGSGGGGSSGGGGGSGGGGSGGSGGGGGSDGSGGSGGGGTGGGRTGGFGGGQRQQQQRRSETQSPQQLREWLLQRGTSRGSDSCPYVIRTGDRAGQTCGRLHTQHRCFSRLDDAWHAEFGDDVERPRWANLLSAKGDCYQCVPPDPSIEAAAQGASESCTLPGTAPAEALHTFTLDSGASRCFFRDSTTLTPLPAPVPVRLADPSWGPIVARSCTNLPCQAVPSGSLSGLHLPSFSMNLVSTAALQDAMVTTTTPGGQRVSICTCTRTGRHLATFTRRPGSSLYTLATEPPQTLLWHHRLDHPCLPRLRGMHSRLLVSGLPRSLPPLPPSPTPPCRPSVEGRQRAAPHSSSFPPTTAPLQTLHMDVWGPARVTGQSHERYFLLVIDDYTRYTTVFPLRSKGRVVDVLIPWICAVRLQPRERFQQDLPVLRLHSDRGGEFSSDLLRDIYRGEGILQSFTLPASPQKNGIAERSIGLVMEVDPPSGAVSGEVPVESGAARGIASRGAEPGGAETGGAEPGGFASASPRLSPQQLCEWLVWHARLRSGAIGAGGAGVTARAGVPRAGDPTESGAAGAGDSGAVGAGAGGAGVGALEALEWEELARLTPPLLCPLPDQSQLPLEPASPLPAPSPFTEQSGGLTERRELASRLVSPVRTARRVPCSRPPPVPDTHAMALRLSSVPLRVPLPAPLESSLFASAAASALVAELVDFAAACHLDYATALVAESESASPPSVGGECALSTDVLEDMQEDFECLAGAVPRFASMLLASEGDPDAPDIPIPRSYAEATTGTYIDEVAPPGANIVDGMWIFRGVDYFQTFSPAPKMTTLRVLLHVAAQHDYELHSLDFSTAFLQGSLHEEIWLRRPPSFTGSFPAGTQWSLRWPVYGLHQVPHEWNDTLRTTVAALWFAPSTADPSLFLRTDTSLPPFYVLVYIDDLVFATADTEALTLVKLELQKRHTCTDLGELRSYLGLQITRDRARRTITLTQSHMVHQVLQRFGFQFSSPQPTLSTSHSLSAPPSDESVEPSGPYPELVGCLMYLMTCTRLHLAYPLSLLARYEAPVRRAWGLCLEDEVRSSCEAEFYAGAMAIQELYWLTYLLTYLGEQPRSPPVLYVDNKAMIALCEDQRLEHRTKHIALRYFLARELQQCGQLHLAYVATRANTADVFTKALPPGGHQRFSTVLGLVPTLPQLLTA